MATLVEPATTLEYSTREKFIPQNRAGRPKGSKNKVGQSVRWAMLEAYRLNGGITWMTQWAKKNPDLFIPLLTKLLPHELAESGLAGNITVIVQRHPDNTSDKPLVIECAPPESAAQVVDSIDGQTPK